MSLNSDQQHAFEACTSNPYPITIIQGKAGSGKSYLVQQLLSAIPGSIILTPTNMAKSVYRQAQTYHSFFYGEFDNLDEGFMNVRNYSFQGNPYFMRRIEPVRTIILDEISMVRADFMEMMNVVCQKARGNGLPFGGIRIICVGDMYQLPPVVDNEDTYRYLIREYGGIYYFNSHVIQNNISEIRYCELSQSVRQKEDRDYERILDDFRTGCSITTAIADLERINSRVSSYVPAGLVTIATSNAEVQAINHRELDKLPGSLSSYPASIRIRKRNSVTDYLSLTASSGMKLDPSCEEVEIPSPFESELVLKPGAQVMFTSSDKRSGMYGYVNGDMGRVVRVDTYGGCIVVRSDRTGEEHRIQRIDRYRYQMQYDERRHELRRLTPYIQKTTQFPLKLAYAFTVHKSQGQTYERMYFDLESPVFAAGQLYVALSRAKSLAGLYLTKPVSLGDIIIDPSIGNFFRRFNSSYGGASQIRIPTQMRTSAMQTLYSNVCLADPDAVSQKVVHQVCCLTDYLAGVGQYRYAVIELAKLLAFARTRFALPYEARLIADQIQHRLDQTSQSGSAYDQLLSLFTSLFAGLRQGDKRISPDKLHAPQF